MKKTPVIGIDLGTTNSLVAYVDDGKPRIIAGDSGNLLPSAVTFLPDGRTVVGQAARELRIEHPDRTVTSIKRLIGKSFMEVAAWLSHIPYDVREVDQKRLAVQIGDQQRSPEEISALILTAIRERAEAHFGTAVKEAVITVPAYFDDTQRQATRDAGKIAGLRVLRILNEPTAAALAYGLHEKKEGAIAVYDLGGGTFDVSVLMVTDGVFRVLSTHGDTFLGGDDMDEVLFRHAAGRLGIDVLAERSPALLQALRKEAERLKIELTGNAEAVFTLDWKGARRQVTVRRDEFDALIRPLLERTFAIARKALQDAMVQPAEFDEVVLVGGSTRVPLVREMAAAFFGRTPHTELDPDEVVALGAAVQADILGGGNRDVMLLDVTPLSLGMETMGGAVAKIIERNTTVPAEATQKFTTYADNQTAVDFTIVQGERELVKDNRLLGRFKLRGIPPMPAGLPVIQVTFSVDESGILTVTALEERSGQKTRVEVVPAHGLLQEEVDQIIEEAYDHAEDDYRNRMLAEIRVEGEQILHATERALAAAGTLATPAEREAIALAMRHLRHVMSETEFRAIKNAYDGLNDVSRDLAERMMNQAVADALRDKRLEDMDS